MFYEPLKRDKEVLRLDPFKALIAPRPIGWISSRSRGGATNLAPYSFFNAFADKPPIIGFSSSGYKDSIAFIEETGEFVWNMATFALREAMNQTSAPLGKGESEFEFAHLNMAPSRLVSAPRVAESPAALECVLIEVKRLHDRNRKTIDFWLVLGEVVGVYLDDGFVKDGRVDMVAMQPIARCGYMDYLVADNIFQMGRAVRLPSA